MRLVQFVAGYFLYVAEDVLVVGLLVFPRILLVCHGILLT